jgi:hypothetical protein
VNVGQELVDVLPLDDVWVTANFKETQLARLRPGQPEKSMWTHMAASGRAASAIWVPGPGLYLAYCPKMPPIIT